METNTLNEKQLLDLLRERLKSFGSQRAFAATLGVSGQYINDLIHERRPITDRIAYSLGYKRIVTFEPIAYERTIS